MSEIENPSRRCKVLIVENNEDLARSVPQLLALEPDAYIVNGGDFEILCAAIRRAFATVGAT